MIHLMAHILYCGMMVQIMFFLLLLWPLMAQQTHLSVPNISTTGDVTVGGDLNVTGSINQSNITNLQVEDKTITLNFGSGDTSSTADNSGIIIQDAVSASTDASILWDTANDRFEFSHGAFFDNKVIIDQLSWFRSRYYCSITTSNKFRRYCAKFRKRWFYWSKWKRYYRV